MAFSNAFKSALSELTPKEKDKLILRLLRKDEILASRLEFELLGMVTAEELRLDLEATIRERLRNISGRNVVYLLRELRSISGTITRHVKITKDKTGEITLQLLLLNEALRLNTKKLEHSWTVKAQKTGSYLIARTFRLLVLIKGVHEDYFTDFAEDLQQLGEQIAASRALQRVASANKLELDWLLEGEIPDDIAQRHAYLRKQGLLR